MTGSPKARWMRAERGKVPLWIKVAYTLFLCVLVPVYWRGFGPTNFLWASDIALFITFVALWLESRLLNSMMAVGVLPFELAWGVDFLFEAITGVHLTGMTQYMFNPELPLYLRGLSLYHFMLALVMILLLFRLGYDRRALIAQSVLVWIVLPVTYLVTDPADNINLVFGLGTEPQTVLPPLAYLGLEMILVPVIICLPVHLVLRRLFAGR